MNMMNASNSVDEVDDDDYNLANQTTYPNLLFPTPNESTYGKKNCFFNFIKNPLKLLKRHSSLYKDVPQTKTPKLAPLIADATKENPYVIKKLKRLNQVILNVGGAKFYIDWNQLCQLPNTRLGKLQQCKNEEQLKSVCDIFNLEKHEFYFDRDSTNFGIILNFYRTHTLHLSSQNCIVSFCDDLLYWGINEHFLDICCQRQFLKIKETINDEIKRSEEISEYRKEMETFPNWRYAKIQKQIYSFIEDPSSSLKARIYSIVSIVLILGATILLIVRNYDQQSHKNVLWDTIENGVIYLFFIEYIIRLIVAPNKKMFIFNFINLIDLFSFIPIIMETIVTENRSITQLLSIFRILRILKISRHSSGLQSLGYTFKQCFKELRLLGLLLSLAVILFSNLMYICEEGRVGFRSIPECFWWATVTLTTVGYGDVIPTTISGKFVSAICSICGVLVIALPVPIIVNKFADYYQEHLFTERDSKRREAIQNMKMKIIKRSSSKVLTSITES